MVSIVTGRTLEDNNAMGICSHRGRERTAVLSLLDTSQAFELGLVRGTI